jgi:hypothetical protein
MFLAWMTGMKTSSVCWVIQQLVVMEAAMVLSSGLFFQFVPRSMMKLGYLSSELGGVWLQNLQHWYVISIVLHSAAFYKICLSICFKSNKLVKLPEL